MDPNITPESRIREMVTNCRSSWLLNKFSLSAAYKMHREQYGEYAYWCQVVFRTWFSFIHVSFRKATSVKKEESSKAKKSRRPISFKTQVRKWCLIIEGTPYLLCEGWLGDFVFTGIMISIFFFSWILIKDDMILPFPSE